MLNHWFRGLAVIGLVAFALMLAAGRGAAAEDGALAKRLVSQEMTRQLAKVDCLQRSWEYRGSRRMMAWLDIGIWRPEWQWDEATTVNLWLDEPDELQVRIKELLAENDRINFEIEVQLPLKVKAWHRVCEWIDTDFEAQCLASFSMRGSFGIERGKVHESKFEDLTVAVEELKFNRTFCQTFRSPIRGIINRSLKKQQARLCAAIEQEINGRALY